MLGCIRSRSSAWGSGASALRRLHVWASLRLTTLLSLSLGRLRMVRLLVRLLSLLVRLVRLCLLGLPVVLLLRSDSR